MKLLATTFIVLLSLGAFAQEENTRLAEYPGGTEQFFQYLKDNLQYPLDAIADSTEGVVLVEFIVSTSGDIRSESINVVRGLRQSCDDEARRLIAASIAWTPARNAGIAVEERIVFPVSFSLN